MPVKFTARIPSKETYGYYEVEADTFAEMIEGEADVRDQIAQGAPVTEAQAMQNLQNAGLVNPNPGLQPTAWQPTTGNEPPACAHGPKKWVPPGVSRNTNKPYPGFWACPAPRGTQCAG